MGRHTGSAAHTLSHQRNSGQSDVGLRGTAVAGLSAARRLAGSCRFQFPAVEGLRDAAILPLLREGQRATVAFLFASAGGLLVDLFASLVCRLSFVGRRSGTAAAAYAGFNERRNVWLALLLSGAAAGLAGVCEVLGPIGRLQTDISPGYRLCGHHRAFVGRCTPWASCWRHSSCRCCTWGRVRAVGVAAAGLRSPVCFRACCSFIYWRRTRW